MIKRDYYKLKQAAEILDCSEDDLIYLAAHGKVSVYVLSTKFNLCFRRYIKGNFVDSGYSHDQLAKLSLETLRELEAGSNDAIVILDRKPVSITEIEDKNLSSQSKQNNWDYLEFCPKGWLYIAPEKLSELYLSGKQIEHLWPPAIRINDCEMVIMADELERFKNQTVENKTKDKATNKQKVNDGWKESAHQIALEILKTNKSLSVDKIAQKTHKIMTEKHSQGQPGMTGRGGRLPAPETIKRQALNGIKS